MANSNYPYVSMNYFSEQFQSQQLQVTKETITRPTPLTMRDEAEFILVLAGELTLELNGNAYTLGQNSMCHLLPYHLVRFWADQRATIYCVRFQLECCC